MRSVLLAGIRFKGSAQLARILTRSSTYIKPDSPRATSTLEGKGKMAEKEYLLTEEGLREKESELEFLKTVKRREVAARIKQALEFGDISENSEYDDAKNEQAFIEGRIALLEKILRNAKILDESDIKEDIVGIGQKVKIKDLETGDEYEYMLVSSAESDPAKDKISTESPVGKAILGKQIGAVVDVVVPVGVLQYEIVAVSR